MNCQKQKGKGNQKFGKKLMKYDLESYTQTKNLCK